MRKELVTLWKQYQDAGYPNGRHFQGFMYWLEKRVLNEHLDKR